jgi:hypothetical protein
MFLNFAACRGLEPEQFKLLAAFAHHADQAGECRVLQAELAAEMGLSASTVCRWTAALVQRGCLSRARIGGGSYRYTIAPRSLAGSVQVVHLDQLNEATPPELPPVKLHTVKSGIAHGASADSGAPADAPALVVPSSELRSSEGEHAPSQDEIPVGWEEAAAAERRLAGLAPVNLACEWRKLVAYSEGQRITIWRWRGWVLKARGERATEAVAGSIGHRIQMVPIGGAASPAGEFLPGDERQQRQARDWVRRGFWLRNGAWGPRPDQPGCTLPAALVAWCLRERAALAAA